MSGISKITINGEELTLNATNDGNGNVIANTYLPLSGGTMSGNIYVNSEDKNNGSGVRAIWNDTGVYVMLHVGSGGYNRGLSQGDVNGNTSWLLFQNVSNNVCLRAYNGTDTSTLVLTPAGSLALNNYEVERVVAKKLTSPGYVKFASGFIIQWCGTTATTGGTTITWPTAWSGYFTYRAVVTRQSEVATDTTNIFNFQHVEATSGIVISSNSSVSVSIIGVGY